MQQPRATNVDVAQVDWRAWVVGHERLRAEDSSVRRTSKSVGIADRNRRTRKSGLGIPYWGQGIPLFSFIPIGITRHISIAFAITSVKGDQYAAQFRD